MVTRTDTGTIPVVLVGSDQSNDGDGTAVMLLPEGAGAVSNVREKNYVNGSRQEIILSGDKMTHGENVIDVSIQTTQTQPTIGAGLQIGKPSERSVRNEILSRFPDVRMGIVTRPMNNVYGPFGLAIGKRSDGARCVFAWQWIDDIADTSRGGSGFSRIGVLLSRRSTPASIRIRICRGDQTADQLAGLIEGLRFTSAEAVERIMTMDRANLPSMSTGVARVSANGATFNDAMPEERSLEASLIGPASTPQPVRVTAAPRPQVAAAPRKRVYVAARPARAARPRVTQAPVDNQYQPVQPAVIPQQLAPTGPVYLGGINNGQSSAYIAPASGPVRLDPSLPSQAYRGPNAAQQAQVNGYGGAPMVGR